MSARPTTRGGKVARKINGRDRAEDKLYTEGGVRALQEVSEQARFEAVNCPHCRKAVHPTNWERHMTLEHSDTPVPLHEADPGRLPLAAIRTDGDTQSRREMNDQTIANYLDAMSRGEKMPPLQVRHDGKNYWLSDGFHRLEATRRAGEPDIAVEVRPGGPKEAFLDGLQFNKSHGLPYSNADKRYFVERLLRDEEWAKWSDRKIAEKGGVSNRFVSNLRNELSVNGSQMDTQRVVERGGTTYTQNTANIGKERPKPSTSVPYMHNIYRVWRANFKHDDLVVITQDGETYVAINRDDSLLRFKAKSRHIQPGSIGLRGGADHMLVSKIDVTLLHEVEQSYNGSVISVSFSDLDEDMQYLAGTALRARNIPLNSPRPARISYGPVEDDYQEEVPSVQVEDEVHETFVLHPVGPDGRPIDYEALTNYKRDSKVTRPVDETAAAPFDQCQTPAYAIDPLLPYLINGPTIWEPAAGEGLLVEALYDAGWKEEHVITSDILTGDNFFDYEPEAWDVLVTNPPFSLKFKWLERCYDLGKPFALLLPVEVLGTKTAQEMMQKHGFEIMLLDQRVDFHMPRKGWNGAGSQFSVLWLCWQLLPEKVMFGSISEGKRLFQNGNHD